MGMQSKYRRRGAMKFYVAVPCNGEIITSFGRQGDWLAALVRQKHISATEANDIGLDEEVRFYAEYNGWEQWGEVRNTEQNRLRLSQLLQQMRNEDKQ
jgi:hypothetical protein